MLTIGQSWHRFAVGIARYGTRPTLTRVVYLGDPAVHIDQLVELKTVTCADESVLTDTIHSSSHSCVGEGSIA